MPDIEKDYLFDCSECLEDGHNAIYDIAFIGTNTETHFLTCPECGRQISADTQDEVIDKWNEA